MMERGLEYLNKIDDEEKRDQIMKRLESLQSGQYRLKSEMDQNERRRQYDEWRKRRSESK
jgi:ketol-acid reductoisomerase